MPQTDDISVIVDYLIAQLRAYQDPIPTPYFKNVWYGDQNNIPAMPAAAVESSTSPMSFAGAPYRVDTNFTIYIMLYLARIADSDATRREVDQQVTKVRRFLHLDHTAGGLVISSHVANTEFGTARRAGALLRAARLTWTGYNKINI